MTTLAALLHADPALCRKHSPNGHPRWMQSPLCVSVAARLEAAGVTLAPAAAGLREAHVLGVVSTALRERKVGLDTERWVMDELRAALAAEDRPDAARSWREASRDLIASGDADDTPDAPDAARLREAAVDVRRILDQHIIRLATYGRGYPGSTHTLTFAREAIAILDATLAAEDSKGEHR